MKFNYGHGVLLAVLALMVVCVSALPRQQPQEVSSSESAEIADARMGGLLDFSKYQKIFKKSYSSLLEEAVRLKYFTASALQTAAAAIKFRFRLINHYLSLNHMSDWTREEFEKIKNKAFAKWARSVSGDRDQQPAVSPPESSAPKLVPGDNEDVAQEVRELVDEHKGEPVYEQLGELLGTKSDRQHERRKREISEDKPQPPRELPIGMLVSAGETEKLTSDWDEHRLNVPSNNPQFAPAQLGARGFKENQLPVAWHSFESHDRAIYDLETLLYDIDVTKLERMLVEQPVGEETWSKPDTVFDDLRQTGCLAPVRYQDTCGSCYAFAMMSIMEFLYCKNTGQRVTFSEQYMVDCGRQVGLNGCSGGSPLIIPNFIRNFGLYPTALYPYRNNEGQCPYSGESIDFKQTGYIRSDNFANSLMISRGLWADALKHGPLLIGVSAGSTSDIYSYGGGVLMGNCKSAPDHVVVLVGHGRQNGREYWLVRNSWGAHWGEGGYLRIDKESNCIKLNFGFAYGVSDPGQFDKMTFVNNAEAVSRLISESVRG